MALIAANCLLYNEPDSALAAAARRLQDAAEQLCEGLDEPPPDDFDPLPPLDPQLAAALEAALAQLEQALQPVLALLEQPLQPFLIRAAASL